MVGQTKYIHGPDSAQQPSLSNFQFMGYINQTSECLPSPGWVTVSPGSAWGGQGGENWCPHSILEVTGGHPVLWFQVSLPWSSYWAHTDHSFPHILLYLDSALNLTLGVYFIACCEILKERNTWKLFWRFLMLLDRSHIYMQMVCKL